MIIEKMSKELGVPDSYLLMVMRTASHRYKTYPIKKRNGEDRIINHPSRALKGIQRWITDVVLCDLPIHESAHAYIKGRSILHNVEAHKNNNFLAKFDFFDFFENISEKNILEFLTDNIECLHHVQGEEDIKFLAKLLTKSSKVTIGAPSSPHLSNAMMYSFDVKVSSICSSEDITYTRYADDLTLSTIHPGVLLNFQKKIEKIAEEVKYPDLSINDTKTVHTSKKHRRMITGLILTDTGEVSYGRKKKRHVRGLIHKSIIGDISAKDKSYLYGILSYLAGIEPTFIKQLKRKYGESIIRDLMTSHHGVPPKEN